MIKQPKTVIEYLEYFISSQKRLLNNGLTAGTIRTYKTRELYLKLFLTRHKLYKCKPCDITIHIIREYELFLLTERKLCNNYAMKCIHILDRILRMAMENGDIISNPADLFKYHYNRDIVIIYLEREDLVRIKKLQLSSSHRLTRDIFLFGCFTGLSFSDIQAFDTSKNIIIGPDKKKWVHVKRKKNGSDTFLPLLPEAAEILNYYYNRLPNKTNQRVNAGLKVIAKKAKIKQVLTSHVARKTFGNILHNELNVPIETVSKMLGHKSIKTTESWYVQTNIKKIAADMKGIEFFSIVA